MSSNKNSNTLGLVLLGLGLLLLWSLIRGLGEIKQAYKRVDEAEKVLEKEEIRKLELTKKLDKVQTGEYIEEVIREELKMQKNDEVVVILPKNEGESDENVSSTRLVEENWQKWWNLIK